MPILSVLAAASFLLTQQPRSITPAHRLNEPWWAQRHEEKLQEVKQGGYDVVFIGDSITHGWDGSWAQGADRIWTAFYAARKPLNLGYSGDRTEHVLWRIDNGELDGLKPKLFVMMIGTNNIGSGDTPEDTARGVEAICDKLHTRFSKTKLLLLGIFPRRDQGEAAARKVEAANKLIEPLGKRPGIEFLDIGKVFLEQDGSMTHKVMYDLLHPSAYGYLLWAEATEPAISKILGKRKNTATIPTEKQETDFYDWQARHEAVMKAKTEQKVDLVMIGDSITHFWGGEPASERQWGKKVWDSNLAPRNALNLGFGWDRTQQVLWRIDHGELDGLDPKVVTILIGTNNMYSGNANGNTNDEIVEGIRAVVDRVRKKTPRAKILLLGILPRGASPTDLDRDRIARINAELAKWDGKQNVFFVDAGKALLDSTGNFLPDVTADWLHPNERGYGLLMNAIEPTLAQLMGDTPRMIKVPLATEVVKSGWTVVETDSEETASEDGRASNAIDGDTDTNWHTKWTGGAPMHPHHITIDFGSTLKVASFYYQGRTVGMNGTVLDYELYLSEDGKTWGDPVLKGAMPEPKSHGRQVIKLTKVVSARYMRFVALSEVNGGAWASAAEIGVLEPEKK